MPRYGVMLAKPFEERLLKAWPETFFAQPKYNGRRARALCVDGKYRILSSEANILPSMQHIATQLDIAMSEFHNKPQFDGELYIHGMSLQNISSLVSPRKHMNALSSTVEFHIFDLVMEHSQYDRLDILLSVKEFLKSCPNIKVASHTYLFSSNIPDYLSKMLSLGFEGCILRHPHALYEAKRTSNMLKLKPRQIDSYKIINAFEAVDLYGYPKGMLGGLVLQSETGDIFQSGAGMLSHEQRKICWDFYKSTPDKLRGLFAVIKYQELSDSNRPLQPILVEITGFNPEGW